MRQYQNAVSPMPKCGYRPISCASTDFGSATGDNPEMFLCRTFDPGGVPVYYLLADPRSWERVEVSPGKWVVRRPEPIPFNPIEITPRQSKNNYDNYDF